MKGPCSWALALAILLSTLLSVRMAAAQDAGVLEGIVSNGTTGELVPGATILLRVFQRMTQIDTRQALADGQGRFRFEGLPVESTIRYIPTTTHEGIEYTTERAIDPTAPQGPVELMVYETTESDEAVSILRAAIAVPSVDNETALIQVLEVITFVNRGNRAYVGELFSDDPEGGVLRVPLPPDALDLSHDRETFGPGGPIRTPNGILGRLPVPPGELVVVYAYKLPFTTDTRTMERTFAYPVETATFLISTEGPRPNSDRLTDVTTADVNGVLNFRLSGEDIVPGEPVDITLTGLPEILLPAPDPGAPGLGGQTGNGGVALDTALRGMGIGIMAVLAVGVALYTMRGRRKQLAPARHGATGAATEGEALEAERQELLAVLAELDDASEAGRIPGIEYERARRTAKQRLMDIMLLIKERAEGHRR